MPLAVICLAAVAFAFFIWLAVREDKASEELRPEEKMAINCVPSGCSNEICAEEGNEIITPCLYLDWYECFSLTKCEVQPDGKCGWTENEAYLNCRAEKE